MHGSACYHCSSKGSFVGLYGDFCLGKHGWRGYKVCSFTLSTASVRESESTYCNAFDSFLALQKERRKAWGCLTAQEQWLTAKYESCAGERRPGGEEQFCSVETSGRMRGNVWDRWMLAAVVKDVQETGDILSSQGTVLNTARQNRRLFINR